MRGGEAIKEVRALLGDGTLGLLFGEEEIREALNGALASGGSDFLAERTWRGGGSAGEWLGSAGGKSIRGVGSAGEWQGSRGGGRWVYRLSEGVGRVNRLGRVWWTNENGEETTLTRSWYDRENGLVVVIPPTRLREAFRGEGEKGELAFTYYLRPQPLVRANLSMEAGSSDTTLMIDTNAGGKGSSEGLEGPGLIEIDDELIAYSVIEPGLNIAGESPGVAGNEGSGLRSGWMETVVKGARGWFLDDATLKVKGSQGWQWQGSNDTPFGTIRRSWALDPAWSREGAGETISVGIEWLLLANGVDGRSYPVLTIDFGGRGVSGPTYYLTPAGNYTSEGPAPVRGALSPATVWQRYSYEGIPLPVGAREVVISLSDGVWTMGSAGQVQTIRHYTDRLQIERGGRGTAWVKGGWRLSGCTRGVAMTTPDWHKEGSVIRTVWEDDRAGRYMVMAAASQLCRQLAVSIPDEESGEKRLEEAGIWQKRGGELAAEAAAYRHRERRWQRAWW